MKRQEILKLYNISDATLRNWHKLNYIKNIDNINPLEIEKILKTKNSVRRNKKTSESNIIPASYVNDKKLIVIINKILSLKNSYNVTNNEILYEAIIKILANYNLTIPNDVNIILGNRSTNVDFINEFEKIKISYNNNNDFLGCLYMALLSIGNKDVNGIFYTPYKIVNEIINSIDFKTNKKILDPGCGSGNFLIQAFKKMKKNKIPTNDIIDHIYGFDIDPIAVILAKINIYILDKDIDFQKIKIYNIDFLNNTFNDTFDIIIGNPPWGKKYSYKEKAFLKNKYGLTFSKLDSFSQFILKSFDVLNDNGTLSFVLPSSILNIGVHEYIRKFLLNYKLNYIKKIGREFKEIVTDVILLSVDKNTNTTNNICKYNNLKIKQDIFLKNTYYNFLVPNPISSNIIEKIKNYNSYHLDKNVKYALGVVTGNNKKYLMKQKRTNNEPIISGKDIKKYNIDYNDIKKYIIFNKQKMQQVAKEELYRWPNKIIYKFIGKKLCFAVENRSLLSLNSANIICLGNEYNAFYISAILNSRITQLYFDECYDTHKVLQRHIKSFFIPVFDKKTMKKIETLSKQSLETSSYNEEIEDIIYSQLKLSNDEINYLKNRYN